MLMEVRQLYYKDENGVEHPYCPVVGEESVFDSSGVSVGRKLQGKQDKLVAGNGITIGADGKTISASGVSDAYTKAESDAKFADKDDIPTTLPASDVSSWAKQPNKPTYTASEVGALPSSTTIPTKTSQLQNDSNYLTEHQSLADYEKVVDVIDVSEEALSISVGSQTRDTDYKCGVLNSLSVTSVTAINKEVNVFFSTGDSVENIPSIPADAKVVGEIELNINKNYVMSIYQGIICCQEIK